MARKSVTDLKSVDKLVDEAVEEFQSVSVIKHEMAMEAYELQDKETQKAIDRIVETLRIYATGYITVQLSPPHGATVPVKLDNEYLGMNLLWLATEIVKDLAFVGIKVENFVFPPSMCAVCGGEVIPEKRTGKKAGR